MAQPPPGHGYLPLEEEGSLFFQQHGEHLLQQPGYLPDNTTRNPLPLQLRFAPTLPGYAAPITQQPGKHFVFRSF